MFHLGVPASMVCCGTAHSQCPRGIRGLVAPPGCAVLLQLMEMMGPSRRERLASQCQQGPGHLSCMCPSPSISHHGMSRY